MAKPTKEQLQTVTNKKAMLEALEKSLGVVTTACKQVGISRMSHYRYLEDDPQYAKDVRDIENVALDFAESKLHKQIDKGDTTACIFYLKTKGKQRGYVERIEQTGANGEAIKTESITKIELIDD